MIVDVKGPLFRIGDPDMGHGQVAVLLKFVEHVGDLVVGRKDLNDNQGDQLGHRLLRLGGPKDADVWGNVPSRP